jgi:hypothetical protein
VEGVAVRFADVRDLVLRGGHLSDRALVDVCMTGERPAHMDRCDICAERAIGFGRWLDDVRALGEADVDAVFPAERMAAQQAQIMRRLEQLDQPARVIAFPRHLRLDGQPEHGHRVSAGWVAVAAAAGLILGVVGSQVSARLSSSPAARAVTAQVAATGPATALDAARVAEMNQIDQENADRQSLGDLSRLDLITPRILPETEQGSVTLAAYSTSGRGGGRN